MCRESGAGQRNQIGTRPLGYREGREDNQGRGKGRTIMADKELESRLIKAANSHRLQRVGEEEMKIFRTCSMDIEATNLHANFGIMLCASFKELGRKVKTFRLDETSTYATRPWDDSELLLQV